MKVCAIFYFLLSFYALEVKTAKILCVFAFPGPSQYIFVRPLLSALAERGHNVTSITPFPQKVVQENLYEIGIEENLGLTRSTLANTDTLLSQSIFERMHKLYAISVKLSENTLKNPAVKYLMRNEAFDLVIADTFLAEALYGLAQHFNAPIIGISTFGTISWVDTLVGNTSPVSYIPHTFQTLEPKMSFTNRLINLCQNILEQLHYHCHHIPQQRAIYEQYFPNARIKFDEILKNFSLILLNQHFTLSYPRPYVPNMIEVGGLHIKQKPEPLPADMQVFLDNATEGVIYFSLGSNFKAKDLPAEKRQIFLNTFSALQQKVLWKFEDANAMPEKPQNVYIDKWFQQSAILAHPNVKVFISHGGWLSTTEAIFHAKPILGMPMFSDQPANVAKAVRLGVALSVEFSKLNEAEFKQKLNALLTDASYTQRVQELSKRFRDQPLTPLETAIFWTEYIISQGGGAHMRNAGQDLNFWQYHSIDTIATLFGGLLLLAVFVLWTLKNVICWIFRLRQQKSVQKLKRN